MDQIIVFNEPESWRLMVENARELESSLGIYEKKVEDNEKETVVVQEDR